MHVCNLYYTEQAQVTQYGFTSLITQFTHVKAMSELQIPQWTICIFHSVTELIHPNRNPQIPTPCTLRQLLSNEPLLLLIHTSSKAMSFRRYSYICCNFTQAPTANRDLEHIKHEYTALGMRVTA